MPTIFMDYMTISVGIIGNLRFFAFYVFQESQRVNTQYFVNKFQKYSAERLEVVYTSLGRELTAQLSFLKLPITTAIISNVWGFYTLFRWCQLISKEKRRRRRWWWWWQAVTHDPCDPCKFDIDDPLDTWSVGTYSSAVMRSEAHRVVRCIVEYINHRGSNIRSLPLHMAECLRRAQPDSVANHVTARLISINMHNT